MIRTTDDRGERANNPAFADLRRFVRREAPRERCEMCGAALAGEHRHLLGSDARKLICACDACAILFGSRGETQYKLIPRAARVLRGFHLSDAQWEALRMPINMAFFFVFPGHCTRGVPIERGHV